MGLTVAPVEVWPLAWIALAPLWVLVFTSAKREKHSLPLSPEGTRVPLPPCSSTPYFGGGYHGLAVWWITGVHPMTWMGVPWLASLAIALFCWIFITLGAALVAIWAVCMAVIVARASSSASSSALPCGVV